MINMANSGIGFDIMDGEPVTKIKSLISEMTFKNKKDARKFYKELTDFKNNKTFGFHLISNEYVVSWW